jgi:Tol biopolymer transport system component
LRRHDGSLLQSVNIGSVLSISRALLFSPDGTRLVWQASSDLWIINVENGTISKRLQAVAQSSLHFSANGSQIIYGSMNSPIIWDFKMAEGAEEEIPAAGGETRIDRISFTPEGSQVVSVGENYRSDSTDLTSTGELIISSWDTQTGRRIGSVARSREIALPTHARHVVSFRLGNDTNIIDAAKMTA